MKGKLESMRTEIINNKHLFFNILVILVLPLKLILLSTTTYQIWKNSVQYIDFDKHDKNIFHLV